MSDLNNLNGRQVMNTGHGGPLLPGCPDTGAENHSSDSAVDNVGANRNDSAPFHVLFLLLILLFVLEPLENLYKKNKLAFYTLVSIIATILVALVSWLFISISGHFGWL